MTTTPFEEQDTFLRVFIPQEIASAQNYYADFHYFWLRHNCDCLQGCRHPKTFERVLDSSEVSLEIRPKKVENDSTSAEPAIRIVWPGDHVSTYPLSWLKTHAYAPNRKQIRPMLHDASLVSINFEELREKYPSAGEEPLSEEGMRVYRDKCGEHLKKYGFVVVLKRGLDTESIIKDFLPSGREVISTHFGRIEDLKTDNTTNQNTDQLGYTDAPVNLHTDQPFIANPPGMQLLQCVTPADEGGDNFVIDAAHAAYFVKHEVDAQAFDLLTNVSVRFHRKQQKFESLQVKPLIQLNEDKTGVAQVRYSYFTYAPHIVDFNLMKNWYKAYNLFSEFVRNPRNHVNVKLESGDFVLYDNWRCFHARKGFKGKRHMRGVYFDANDVYTMTRNESYTGSLKEQDYF